jgi:hypothetical protein
VADIISIDEKLSQSREKRDALIRRRKIQAVRKVFQCTHCAIKCEKCGIQIAPTCGQGGDAPVGQTPYRLCESCAEEYHEYCEQRNGGSDPLSYWHNDAWLEVWKRWIAYQEAIGAYLKSKEFLQLLQELKPKKPDK